MEIKLEDINENWIEKNKSNIGKIVFDLKSYYGKNGIISKPFADNLKNYRKILKIIRILPKKYSLRRLRLNNRDWQNILYLLICVDKKQLSKDDLLDELNKKSPSLWLKHLRPAIEKLIERKRVIGLKRNARTIYIRYYDNIHSTFQNITHKYFKCPKCKRLSTKQEETEVRLNGGLPYYCCCEFLKGKRLIKMVGINKKAYLKLKNETN